jgi:hypothetical protein
LEATTVREKYPALYNIVHRKHDILQKVMETSPPSMTFMRDLVGPRLASWNELRQRLASVQLLQGSDELCWGLTENGVFSVGSMYKALCEPIQPKFICKIKIPLKTKVFCMVPSSGYYSY